MKTEEILNGMNKEAIDTVHSLVSDGSETTDALETYAWLKRVKEFADGAMKNIISVANGDFVLLKEKDPNAKAWDVGDFATVSNYALPPAWQYPEEVVLKEAELKSLKEQAKKSGAATKLVKTADPDVQVTFKVTLKKI